MSNPDILFETTMIDHRLGDAGYDGSEKQVDPGHLTEDILDDLTEEQRRPYQVQVSRSGYGGLWLDVTLPDGSKAAVLFEGDRGALTINTFAAGEDEHQDESDVNLHLDSRGTHVANNFANPEQGMLYGKGKSSRVGAWEPKQAQGGAS